MRFQRFIELVKPSFVADWYHELLLHEIECALETGGNLLVSMPPGAGKTECIAILLPAYLIALDALTHIISLANSDSLSRIASSNILRIVQSPAFQDIAPCELDKATEQTFQIAGNDGRPTLHAAGINGQLTGHRAKFLIFDDLLKSLSEAYSDTVREKVWSNFNSAAETRLLPTGAVFGIQTRWHMNDPIGMLLSRAAQNPESRQFTYVSLSATNVDGASAFIYRDGKPEFLPAYKSLATKAKQPYSFSPRMLRGKRADLGPTLYSTLYQQQPVAQDAIMFPQEIWGTVDGVVTDEYTMIVSSWDTAAKDKANNDPSCNVVLGRRTTGDFVVLDCFECRATFDRLFPIVMQRSKMLAERMGQIPLMVVEDASSGQQLGDLIQAE